MLGSILNPSFVTLLDEIAQHFRVQEQKHFESYDLRNPYLFKQIENHDFLKYIDLALAMSETHIKLDPEVAVRLMQIPKYRRYIGCNYQHQDFEMDFDVPDQYESIENLITNFKKHKADYNLYQYVLWKYEYQK